MTDNKNARSSGGGGPGCIVLLSALVGLVSLMGWAWYDMEPKAAAAWGLTVGACACLGVPLALLGILLVLVVLWFVLLALGFLD